MITPSMDMQSKLNKFWLTVGMCMCACLVCLSSLEVQAAPAYGTKMPQQKEFFMGAQTHCVFERKLEADHGELRSLQHFLTISYGVTDWLSLDLKGGAGNIDHENERGIDLSYASFVGGGYGFRVRVLNQEKMKAVVGFQHISTHPYSRNIGEEKYKSVLDDWQLSGLVSYSVNDMWTPYVGGKVSRMDQIQWMNGERDRIKSDESKSFGVILGTDILLNEKMWINVEGQAVDVQALSISLNGRF